MLRYDTTGDPVRPPILFLHGFMGSGADWAPVVASLRSEFYCITAHLPGHGASLSLDPAEAYTFPGAARALDSLLDRLSIPRCGVVGYSMGGRVALYFALQYPDRCSRLVLESASPGLETVAEQEARRGVDEARAVRLESGTFEQFLDEWYRQPFFASLARDDAQYRRMIAERLKNDPAELAKALRGIGAGNQPSLWPQLGDLDVRTLFIAGAQDGKYVEMAERMALLGDHVRTAVFQDASHNVHLEYPAEYADLLRAFFSVSG